MRHVLAVILFAFASTWPLAEEARPVELTGVEMPVVLESVLSQAVRDHNRARDGVEDLAGTVVETLEAVEPSEGGGHPVLLAYLGSCYTLMGRDAGSVMNAMRYTNRGIRILDEAVEIAPESFAVRMVRAFNNFALPAMFKRKTRALKDMKVVISLYEKDPSPTRAAALAPVFDHLIDVAEADNDTAEVARLRAKRKAIVAE